MEAKELVNITDVWSPSVDNNTATVTCAHGRQMHYPEGIDQMSSREGSCIAFWTGCDDSTVHVAVSCNGITSVVATWSLDQFDQFMGYGFQHGWSLGAMTTDRGYFLFRFVPGPDEVLNSVN